jgi:hypothetical protein
MQRVTETAVLVREWFQRLFLRAALQLRALIGDGGGSGSGGGGGGGSNSAGNSNSNNKYALAVLGGGVLVSLVTLVRIVRWLQAPRDQHVGGLVAGGAKSGSWRDEVAQTLKLILTGLV